MRRDTIADVLKRNRYRLVGAKNDDAMLANVAREVDEAIAAGDEAIATAERFARMPTSPPDAVTLLAYAVLAGCPYRTTEHGVEVWWQLVATGDDKRNAGETVPVTMYAARAWPS